MKRICLLLLALVILICAVGCGEDNPTVDIEYLDESSSNKAPSSSEEASSSEETSSLPTQNEVDTTAWELVLVNGSNPIEEDYEPELSQIKSKYASANARFDSRAVEALNSMCDAAYEDGIWLWVSSAYRSHYTQTYNFNNEVKKVLEKNPDMSREDAEEKAATVVAMPGTSEHQLGLAIDFNPINETFKDTKQSAWLMEHAHEYGFILRYTEEKQSVTGVIDEPWHYRYVGVENAKALKESGLCLEEYLGAE